MINFMKIRPVGAEFFHGTDRETKGKHDEITFTFRNSRQRSCILLGCD
jgi:hypothetical protein